MKIHLRIALALLCAAIPCTAFASHGSDDGPGDDNGGRGGGKHESEPEHTVVRGPITAVSPTEITVGGLTFVIDGATQLKGKDDATVDISAFAVGDFVKVESTEGTGTLTAKEIELEDDSSSSDDNHRGHGGSKSSIVVGKCAFPALEIARQSVEKSIRTSFSDAGVEARVKVRFKIASKDPSQEFTGASGANGVTIAVDPSTGAAVTLGGAIAPIPCAGTITARVDVFPAGATSPTTSTATLPITGEFGTKGEGRR